MYRQRNHYLHVPRSFTTFRMTGGRRESPCAQQTQPFCANCGPCGPAPLFLPGSTGDTKANPVTPLPTPCLRGGWRAQRAGRGQPKAAYIIYCPAGQSTTLSVQRTLLNLRTLRIFLNHNPSTQPAAEGGCNLRARRARPPLGAAPPQPSARRAVKPKNLRPQSGRRTLEPFAPFGRKTL